MGEPYDLDALERAAVTATPEVRALVRIAKAGMAFIAEYDRGISRELEIKARMDLRAAVQCFRREGKFGDGGRPEDDFRIEDEDRI